MKETDPLKKLRAVVAKYPSQKAAAEALRVPQSYLSDVLHERRPFSAHLLTAIGLRRAIVAAILILLLGASSAFAQEPRLLYAALIGAAVGDITQEAK